MPIWSMQVTAQLLNDRGKNTMAERIGIEITEVGENFLRGTMPVDPRTKQPIGLLHGGASAAFAETLASTAANVAVDPSKEYCVGLEINANHISSVREGVVIGTTTPIHLGRSTQVWETRITQGEKLICISRMTLAVLKRG